MDAINALKADFRQKMTGEMQFLDVPEIKNKEGVPLRIYYKPCMTLKEQQKILALQNQDKAGEAIAQTLIFRALDEDGNRLFKRANMPELMNEVDPNVTSRIVADMANKNDDSIEDIAKN